MATTFEKDYLKILEEADMAPFGQVESALRKVDETSKIDILKIDDERKEATKNEVIKICKVAIKQVQAFYLHLMQAAASTKDDARKKQIQSTANDVRELEVELKKYEANWKGKSVEEKKGGVPPTQFTAFYMKLATKFKGLEDPDVKALLQKLDLCKDPAKVDDLCEKVVKALNAWYKELEVAKAKMDPKKRGEAAQLMQEIKKLIEMIKKHATYTFLLNK